jgi:hypothetical protein
MGDGLSSELKEEVNPRNDRSLSYGSELTFDGHFWFRRCSASLQAKLALWNCIIKKTLHLAEDAMNGEGGTQIVCTAFFLTFRSRVSS